ncbi:maltose alpha-D-glucosyltransferase [Gracilaria domingensis]|nr:maltose alpha-D-glucosyltransferase [Gracilaria domingensis]
MSGRRDLLSRGCPRGGTGAESVRRRRSLGRAGARTSASCMTRHASVAAVGGLGRGAAWKNRAVKVTVQIVPDARSQIGSVRLENGKRRGCAGPRAPRVIALPRPRSVDVATSLAPSAVHTAACTCPGSSSAAACRNSRSCAHAPAPPHGHTAAMRSAVFAHIGNVDRVTAGGVRERGGPACCVRDAGGAARKYILSHSGAVLARDVRGERAGEACGVAEPAERSR